MDLVLLSIWAQQVYVQSFVYQAKPIQPPAGSSELHHLRTSTDYSLIVKPCTNMMQTKLLKVFFLHLMKSQQKELDDLRI